MIDVAERVIYPVTITKIIPYVQVVDMMDMKQSAIHVAAALEVANQLRLIIRNIDEGVEYLDLRSLFC